MKKEEMEKFFSDHGSEWITFGPHAVNHRVEELFQAFKTRILYEVRTIDHHAFDSPSRIHIQYLQDTIDH